MVLLATHLAHHRQVAVKVIHPELVVNRTLAARFLAEARLVARARHPNIVTVHTAGEAEGHLYFVMDYLPGETLRQRHIEPRKKRESVARLDGFRRNDHRLGWREPAQRRPREDGVAGDVKRRPAFEHHERRRRGGS